MSQESTGSHTHWIRQLQAGDEGDVQQKLWDAYFHALVRMARHQLGAAPRRAADEEDVALDALNTFFRRAKEGEFSDLRDRTNLWPLLVKITARKASNQRRVEKAKKRSPSGDRKLLQNLAGEDALEAVIGREPTPQFAAQSCEEADRLIGLLKEDYLRDTVRLKLQGLTNLEISRQMGVIPRSIERRLAMVRRRWEQEFDL